MDLRRGLGILPARKPKRIRFIAAAVLAAGYGFTATSADAAVPRLLMFSGHPLVRPVVLSDWSENSVLVEAWVRGRAVAPSRLRGRPSLRVSLFWGPEWNDYVDSGKPLRALKPNDANQFGRFYPAVGRKPALLDLPWVAGGDWPKRVPAAALAILERRGVPITL